MSNPKFRFGKTSRFDVLSRGLNRKRGEMNKTEARYALEMLDTDPDVVAYWFEPFTLRISHPPEGQPAKYTPDFMILKKDGLTIIDDVKSGGIDDNAAIVRIKACAELFPLWVFRLVKPIAKKNGGGFKIQIV